MSAGARLRATLGSVALSLLAACGGGGGGDSDETAASCDVATQKQWLRGYMNDNYFWYASSPNPDPAAYASVAAYFDALLYRGADPAFPYGDDWSYHQTTEAFERFFGDGESLGYGMFVAGLEVEGRPDQPLYVRYIEPQSPAAQAGVVRGDRILSANGRTAADMIASNDFSALSASASGQTLTLVLRNAAGSDRTVALTSRVFALTPVPAPTTTIVMSPGGRLMGYLMIKDMISQAGAPMDAAFAHFKQQGVQDLVLDLRYNGGGLVSTASRIGSQIAGNRNNAAGQPFAQLLYNDRQSSRNQTFAFAQPAFASALGLSRVYVLTGARTCSASEQVVNGLRPYVEVVTIGDTTCGKPFGFLPQENGCGTTYSAVNFESVNALRQGRYVNGFQATCRVAEDFTVPLANGSEPLLVAAAAYADTGACPAGTGVQEQPLALKLKAQGRRPTEAGEHPAMLPL